MTKIIMLLTLGFVSLPALAEKSNFSVDDVGQFNLTVTTLTDATVPAQRMTLTYTCEGSSEKQEIYLSLPICFMNFHEWKRGVLTLHYALPDMGHGQITCSDYAQEFNLRLLCPKH